MSIDINDYIESALHDIIEKIGEVYRQANTLWEAHGADFDGAMNELEKLLRTVSDSVEIFQNYNGQYDRVQRQCFGDHPGFYEVQCRLCEVQPLCSEETARRNPHKEGLPNCFKMNPLQSQPRCRHCSLFRLCLEETRNLPEISSKPQVDD
ncbi:MAG: hypothetical protein ACLP5H_09860 [Desulfomonilaceae bacterium]